MKKALFLVSFGILIAAIAWFGYKKVNTKSDIEHIIDFQLEQKKKLETLREQPYPVPESCKNIPIKSFSRVCDNEIYEGEPVIAWNTGIEPFEANCIADSYHVWWERYYQLKQQEYDANKPVKDWQLISFACDIPGDLSLFVDSIDPNDPSIDSATALKAWYAYKQDPYGYKKK